MPSNSRDIFTTLTTEGALLPPDILQLQNPQIKPMLALAKNAPFVLQAFYGVLGFFVKRSQPDLVKKMLASLPASDQTILANNPDLIAMMHSDVINSMQGGAKGAVQDMQVVIGEWGFALEQIKGKVYVRQGEADPNVVPAMAHYYAQRLPNCETTFVPNAGHLLLFSHLREILQQLLA
jgi:pimeloyl-ACP methyl ester carboxylesterase